MRPQPFWYCSLRLKIRKVRIESFPDLQYIDVVLPGQDYIIPPIPPAGIAGASSLMFATTDSVVRSVDATLVAF